MDDSTQMEIIQPKMEIIQAKMLLRSSGGSVSENRPREGRQGGGSDNGQLGWVHQECHCYSCIIKLLKPISHILSFLYQTREWLNRSIKNLRALVSCVVGRVENGKNENESMG